MSGTLIPIDGPTICNKFIFSRLETPGQRDALVSGVHSSLQASSEKRIMKAHALRGSSVRFINLEIAVVLAFVLPGMVATEFQARAQQELTAASQELWKIRRRLG
jgi:hypothetical protein